MKPSTTERATSSKFPIRARTTGSTKRPPGLVDAEMEFMVSPLASGLGLQASGLNPAHGRGWLRRRAGESGLKAEAWRLKPAPSHSRPWRRHGLEQPVHEGVGRDAFRLRVEVLQHAGTQHGMSYRPNIVEALMLP